MDVEEEDEKGAQKSEIDELKEEIKKLKAKAEEKEKEAREAKQKYTEARDKGDKELAAELKTEWLTAEDHLKAAQGSVERAEKRLELLLQERLATRQQGKQEAALSGLLALASFRRCRCRWLMASVVDAGAGAGKRAAPAVTVVGLCRVLPC